ncbi:structural maintenance of chromosomes protein 6 [Xyrichtys novacula]|uniref:Structural maintenance of chromosomes protein 6 n=1 Tax=Xyrichtys novacula TaxID=13765 RepID=A0AAV1GJH8_XYRNO|nr:structural maintenance of chromosomes protein 6 [Xyrichtys novacula]
MDYFNIQPDNPVSILSQEMSKQFLDTQSEADKYKFFMKATLLERMKTNYSHIKQFQSVTRQQVEEMEKCLKNLKQDFLQKQDRYENLQSFSEMRIARDNLKKAMAWCLIIIKEDIKEEEEKTYQHQSNLQLCQTEITQIETKLQDITNNIRSLRKTQESQTEDCLDSKEKLKIIYKALETQEEGIIQRKPEFFCELVYFPALNKIKQSKQEQNLLQDKINQAKISLSQNSDREPEYTKQQEKICSLKEQLAELENEFSQLNQEIESKQQALLSVKEERDKLRKVHHPEFPFELDAITVSNPTIMNCLIDMREIEKVLIIKDKDEARGSCSKASDPETAGTPSLLMEAMVCPKCYYSSDSSMVRFPGGDLETEISMLESELENQQAQLSRFQLQSTSKCDEISSMENTLNSTIMTLRRTLASVNQIKATITELETAGEEHIAAVSSLEDVAKAFVIGPERQQVTGSPKSIDAEITRLPRRAAPQGVRRGPRSLQTEDQPNRKNRYKVMLRSLSSRCRFYFTNVLMKMNCSGSSSLFVSVSALWLAYHRVAFRCLDEFDVFTDMRSRRISLDLLLELSQRQKHRQFIFTTLFSSR